MKIFWLIVTILYSMLAVSSCSGGDILASLGFDALSEVPEIPLQYPNVNPDQELCRVGTLRVSSPEVSLNSRTVPWIQTKLQALYILLVYRYCTLRSWIKDAWHKVRSSALC